MYLEHYKLKVKPFQITVDPKFLWLGEKHKEALATLRYGILDNRGFLLLTGEVGTGKTILINRLVSMLDIDTVVATLPDPDLESMDFYNLLADGLNMKRTFDSKAAFLIHLRDFLYQSYAKQQQVLLIIDESQRLNHRLMEDIRVLSNIEMHDRKLINIFFVGQQEFNSILMTPQNRALAQRITVRYHIEPLDKKETGDYIHHRLNIAGSNKKLFDDSAITEVYQFSGGIPRLINIICDHALLTGYAQGVRQIDGRIILECAEELRIPAKMSVGGTVFDNAPSGTVAPGAGGDNASAGKNFSRKTENAADTVAARKENGSQAMEQRPGKPIFFTLLYAFIVLGIICFGIFWAFQYNGGNDIQYNAEDLTPQKYRTTLEREKELLADKIQNAEIKEKEQSKTEAPEIKPKPVRDTAAIVAPPEDPTVGQKEKAEEKPAETVPEATEKDEIDAESKPLAEQDAAEIEPLPLMMEKIVIYFSVNSNEIDQASVGVLDKIATYLVQHPKETINIRGYTDSSGSDGYNESVSQFRANTVKSYLMGKGVWADNINTFAMGAINPIASNDSMEGRRRNRRVEIEFPQSFQGEHSGQ